MRPLDALLALALVAGCADAEPGPAGPAPAAGCPIGTTPADGACLDPGVPPEMCGVGFAPAPPGGCEAVLPATPCPPGQMAVPGDGTCREPLACGRAPWGDVVTSRSTQFVDASYPGVDSDGSSDKPWTTIQEGVDAAAPGAVVAVAAGDYVEDVVIVGKGIELRGRCPALVTMRAASMPVASLEIRQEAHGTVVSGVSLSSATRAIAVSGAEGVVLEQLRIHDTGGTGLIVQDFLGPTEVLVRGALFERATGAAVIADAARVRLEACHVRDTSPLPDGTFGRGLEVQEGAELVLSGSLVERTRDVGVHVSGAVARIESSVVRDMLPELADSTGGRAINVQASGGVASSLELYSSVVANARDVAVFVSGSNGVVEATVVRDTLARESDGFGGYSLVAQNDRTLGLRSTASLRLSLVLRSADAGVVATASSLSLERVLVQGTLPATKELGRGIDVQHDVQSLEPADATVVDSRIEGAHDLGVAFLGATGSLTNVAVSGTLGRVLDGLFGDGILVLSTPDSAGSVQLERVLVEGSARAGVASFGAEVTLTAGVLECNALDIVGETYIDRIPSLEDGGGNRCGCADEQRACQLVSAGLQPPEPLSP